MIFTDFLSHLFSFVCFSCDSLQKLCNEIDFYYIILVIWLSLHNELMRFNFFVNFKTKMKIIHLYFLPPPQPISQLGRKAGGLNIYLKLF